MNGFEIKRLILDSGLKLWQVAERWGVSDGNFSRRLRKPFDENEVNKINKIISDIKASKEERQNV